MKQYDRSKIEEVPIDEADHEPDFHEAEDNKDDYFCHKRREP